jgi:RNA polymerase sigma-70 factor (sigma-E family)
VTFEEFVEQRGAALLRLAYVLTGDHHAAEDLAQTALAEVYRYWRKVSAARSPEAYARRVLVNAFLSARRRRWTTERPTEIADHHVPPVADPAAAFVEREALRARVAALPPRSRTVLVLRFWADLDDDAIAEAMGTTASTVRATAARALAALRSDGTADLEEAR